MIKKIKQLLIRIGVLKSPLEKYLGILEGKIDLSTDEYLKIRKEEGKLIANSPLDEFLGLYEGKINLTTKEYLKIRKEEAKKEDKND
jgi:hypothetical protein